ncbi:MAG: PAS domain-containing sensor histidine kinase [Phycisphaerae bacterium]
MIAAHLAKREPAELVGIMQAYNEVTDRLKQSHELLRAEVCRLRGQLEEKNRELRRRERLAALGEMAAGVAHEIRNPLGGIKLYASLLEQDLVGQTKPLDLAQRITVGVCKLERIVGDILAFAAGSEPKCQVCDMGGLLEAVLLQAAPRCALLEATIEVEPELRRARVDCDAVQIERALVNLVLNALDAVGPGGHVWVRGATRTPEAEWFGISVEDDGPGIPTELQQRVFNPFFTTKDTGTGLGLAIVHRIAESHGGVIQVSNRDGGGALFRLCLPWCRVSTQTDQGGV